MRLRLSRRSSLAIAVFLGVAALLIAGRSYQAHRAAQESFSNTLVVKVTSGADRGAGTLREALFIVATAPRAARIALDTPRISLRTALPPIVNAHGVRIVAQGAGSEIDARALRGGPVLDVAAPNVSIQGIAIRNCRGSAILVRAARFRLDGATLGACAVGVDVAGNSRGLLLENDQFIGDRLGVRFAASSPDTTLAADRFSGDQEAGVWAVRGVSDLQGGAISVRDDRFDHDHTGIVTGNINILIEQNQINGAQVAAVDLVGAGAVVRANRVNGGSGMGILVEGAHAVLIEHNEISGLPAYGIMVRGSSDALVSTNRLYDCAYGMAFVQGQTGSPSTAVDNVIIEPRYDGIDVVGDAPILRRNRVIRPHAFALRVENLELPSGRTVVSTPFLDHNSFGPPPAAALGTVRSGAPRQ
jgi:hypothetical protein